MSKVQDLAAGIVETVEEIERLIAGERKAAADCNERHRLMDIRERLLDSRETSIVNRETAQKQTMEELAKVRTERRAALEREKKLADERDTLRDKLDDKEDQIQKLVKERDTLAEIVNKQSKKEPAGATA